MLKAMLKNEYLISCIKKFNTVFWGMISIILLNRYLGPELKGEYAYVTNLLSILMVILGFGISTIYPVYKRKDDKKYFRIFVKLVIIQFITYISLGLILCTISTDFNLRVLAILTPICVLASEIGYINLVEEFKFNAIVAIISAFINAILFVFAYIFLDKNLIVAYVIYAIKELLIIILTLISIKKRKVEKVKVHSAAKCAKSVQKNQPPLLKRRLETAGQAGSSFVLAGAAAAALSSGGSLGAQVFSGGRMSIAGLKA